MCLYPKLVKNRRYTVTKKNNGNVPTPKDPRVLYVPVECGYCMECNKRKSNWWKVRLSEEIKEDKTGKFITFTFSNEAYTRYVEKVRKINGEIEGYLLDNEVATMATREFLERWRKKFKKSVKHWLITELGHEGTENIHMHGIIWAENVEDIEERWNAGKEGPNGFVWKGKRRGEQLVNYVADRTISYMTKYMTKKDTKHVYYKPKILNSPGIGANYTKQYNARLNVFKGKETDTTYKTAQGRKMSLPVYWRNKLYTEDEREELWLHQLDKNERWVGGERVEADKEEEYNKLVEYYRKKNYKLGYPSPTDYDAIEYENKRRKLMQNKRMNKEI